MNKKRILIRILLLLGIVITMVCLVQCTVGRIRYIKSGLSQYVIADFKSNYKKSFEIVSDKLYEIYCDEKEKNGIEELRLLSLCPDEWTIKCYIGEKKTYQIVIEPSNELKQATKMVSQAFSNVYPDAKGEAPWVTAHDNRVDFNAGNVPYVVIRTMDYSRPGYLFSPDEDDEVYIKKITRGWYHGTSQPRRDAV